MLRQPPSGLLETGDGQRRKTYIDGPKLLSVASGAYSIVLPVDPRNAAG